MYALLETPISPPERKSKLFLADDPALVVLYSQLRQKTLQTLHGASKVSPRTEWEFVLHNARLYDRMGCDLLGLDLVRNWEFLPQLFTTAAAAVGRGLGGNIVDPRTVLKRRASLVVDDMSGGVVRNMLEDMKMKTTTAATVVENGGTLLGLAEADEKVNKAGTSTKSQPTVFHEPDPNSLLDSFGF